MARGVPQFFTGLIQHNAVTGVFCRWPFGINEPFKLTQQGVLLSPAQAGSIWTFSLRLSETFNTSLYTVGYFSLRALESGRFVVLVTKSMRSLSFVVASTPCSCSLMTSAIRTLCASTSFSYVLISWLQAAIFSWSRAICRRERSYLGENSTVGISGRLAP